MGSARVGIVIVTFNSDEVIGDCLTALDGDEFDIVVIDNASSDTTCAVVAGRFPGLTLIRNDENAGFARAVNRAASTLSSDLVMLLNPDAVIESDAVRALAESVRAHPDRIGAPVVRDPSGVARIAGAGRFPTPRAMFLHYSGLSRLSDGVPGFAGHYLTGRQVAARSGLIDVQWVSGACLMMSAALWGRLGGLSERWFMYAEDIELCWRAAHVDMRGGAEPACFVDTGVDATHVVGGSSKRDGGDATGSPLRRSDWVRNLFDFFCLSMASRRRDCLLWGCATATGLLLRSAVFCLQGARPGTRGARHRRNAVAFARHAAAVLAATPGARVGGLG